MIPKSLKLVAVKSHVFWDGFLAAVSESKVAVVEIVP